MVPYVKNNHRKGTDVFLIRLPYIITICMIWPDEMCFYFHLSDLNVDPCDHYIPFDSFKVQKYMSN